MTKNNDDLEKMVSLRPCFLIGQKRFSILLFLSTITFVMCKIELRTLEIILISRVKWHVFVFYCL